MFDGLKIDSMRMLVLGFVLIGFVSLLLANPISLVKGIILLVLSLIWFFESNIKKSFSDGIQSSDFSLINSFSIIIILTLFFSGLLLLLGFSLNNSFVLALSGFSLVYLLFEAILFSK